ncbi:MAG: hypothetical protein QXM27_03100 [Candidatus Pacearchaeota archaeon]
MKNVAHGEYGEEVWEKKIRTQNEVGVIAGTISSLDEINKDTLNFMKFFDKEISPLIKRNAKILDLGGRAFSKIFYRICEERIQSNWCGYF